MLPITLLSGFSFPIDQMPRVIQGVTLIIHARYYIAILRAVFLKGSTIGDLLTPILALILYALVIGWLADDSGVIVPAAALPFAVPLVVSMAVAVSAAAVGGRYLGSAFAEV